MTGPEHYREAERLIEYAGREFDQNELGFTATVERAQVHALLALAAATALKGGDDTDTTYGRTYMEWWNAAGPSGAPVANGRPVCPAGCGCRVGPDSRGNYDADRRECGCDGPCSGDGPLAVTA